jgi:hypothetical protein
VIIDCDPATGRATSIERINILDPSPVPPGTED